MLIDSLLVIGAYLLGSVSSAILVCRMMGLQDPRTFGSYNPGATNVLRLGGKKPAAMTLAGDTLKGLIPMLVAHALGASEPVLAMTAMAAFLGHLYPVFFGFKGGKGVATALGAQFGLHWGLGLAVAGTWLFIAKVMKISSLAALVSMTLAPLYLWAMLSYWVPWEMRDLLIMQVAMTVILIWRHRSNIRNLVSGAEGKISNESGPE
jgi:glycerol-3-phosphate acyltransferase PlsY